MRFVPPKSLQQQSELMVHRARQGFVQQRTATINRIRGLLSEFGVVLPLKAATVRREAMRQLEDLPGWANTVGGDLLSEVHRLDERRHAMVRELVEQERIPFSVVAPFRGDHPLFAAVDPFVMQNSSKGGTLDMLINAGQFHDAIAEGAITHGTAVFGSSANLSLTGSKYRYADIDAPVREAAAIHFDYGQSKYAHKDGLASTIIDFGDFSVIRVGHCFDRLKQAFAARFGITLRT